MYSISRGGYNARHPKPFLMSKPDGLDCPILLIVKSPARFRIGEDRFDVTPGCAIIIQPGTPYQYHDLGEDYKNDWLYFQTTDPDFDAKYGSLMNHPIALGGTLQFTQYIQHLLWEESYAPEEFRSANVSMLLQVMLNKLLQEDQTARRPETYTPYASGLRELRLAMQSQPNRNYTPAELALSLNISPSYFQALYREFFGVPFKTDLINMRLDYAQSLILETNLTLDQIAAMSGYHNEIHFFRQFKAKTGMTPREYQGVMKRLP